MRFRGLLIAILLIVVGTTMYRLGEESTPAPASVSTTAGRQVIVVEDVEETIDPRTVIGDSAPDVVNVVVEIQQGTQTRYVLDDGVLTLAEAPYHPLNIPGDYGVLPQTIARGGDPLGVIILTTDPTPPGTLIEAKPIALLVADEGTIIRNVILAVPANDIRYRDVEEIADLQQNDKDDTIDFIKNYRRLDGRPIAGAVDTKGSATAKRIIEIGMRAYLRASSEK